jgi:hypothetical protein
MSGEDYVAFRVSPAEKRALRVLAGEQNQSMTAYLLAVLRAHTDMDKRARAFAAAAKRQKAAIK